MYCAMALPENPCLSRYQKTQTRSPALRGGRDGNQLAKLGVKRYRIELGNAQQGRAKLSLPRTGDGHSQLLFLILSHLPRKQPAGESGSLNYSQDYDPFKNTELNSVLSYTHSAPTGFSLQPQENPLRMQETVAKPSRSFVQTERQFTGRGHPKPHGGSPGSGNSSHGLASPSIPGQHQGSHTTG